MLASIRILPGPTADSGFALCPTVIIQIDNVRYLFNVPEGTTRTLSQRRAGMLAPANNGGAVFLPATYSEVMGGLHGLLMSIADSCKDGKRNQVRIVGAPNITYALAAGRWYNKRETMSLKVKEASSDAGLELLHDDGIVKVHALKVYKGKPRSSEEVHKEPEEEMSEGEGRAHDPEVQIAEGSAPKETEDAIEEGQESEEGRQSKQIIRKPSSRRSRRRSRSASDPPKEAAASNEKHVQLGKRRRYSTSSSSSVEDPDRTGRPRLHSPSLHAESAGHQSAGSSSMPAREPIHFDPDVDPRPWNANPSLWRAFNLHGDDARRFHAAVVEDMYKYVPGAKGFEPEGDPLLNDGGANGGLQVEDPAVRAARRKGPANRTEKLPPPPFPVSWEDGALPPVTLTYIFETPRLRGKMVPKKAEEVGIPSGEDLGKLANGQSVTISRPTAWADWTEKERKSWVSASRANNSKAKKKGKKQKLASSEGEKGAEIPMEMITVNPEDVLGASESGSAFIQTYLPSKAYLPSLLESDAFAPYQKEINPDVAANVVLHCVAREVLEDPDYQAWMSRFRHGTDHIISCPDYCPDMLNYPSASMSQLKLSKLDENVFSLPFYSNKPSRAFEDLPQATGMSYTLNGDITTRLVPYMPHSFRHHPTSQTLPQFSFEHDDQEAQEKLLVSHEEDEPSTSSDTGELSAREKMDKLRKETWPVYLKAAAEAKASVEAGAAQRPAHLDAFDKVIITPLGTGSAVPSKYRNVSGTLIQTPSAGNILLDAGEGTYGQICRKFGRDGAEKILRNLRIVFISHLHADHHLGIARILNARLQLDPPPHHAVNVICNRMNRFALDDYQAIERHRDSKDHKLAFIDSANADMHGPPLDEVPADGRRYRAYTDSALNSLCSATGFEQISTVSVSHRSGHCYGIVLRHSEGWSIAYSGDTMPCANMVDAAKDVTVLIHEATIEDDQPEMAAMKGHSTFGQAIQVANEAGAECCLLTHFSQRYPKLARLSKPEQPSDSLAKSPLIGLAFDLMSVSLADFWKLQHYQPAIEALYAGEEELNSKTSNQTSSAREVISAKNAAAAAAASGEKLQSTRKTTQPELYSFPMRLTLVRGDPVKLDRSDVARAIDKAVMEMHGEVGSAFLVDVENLDEGKDTSYTVWLKTGFDNLRQLEAALSAASPRAFEFKGSAFRAQKL